MAALDAPVTDNPVLAHQAEILARPSTQAWQMANAIRALAIDAVEAAKSGHPGMPMGMADVATAAVDPLPQVRRRGSALARPRPVRPVGRPRLHAAVCAALPHRPRRHGHREIKQFRQLHSPAAGHPEFGLHPAIETTTGPLGQGIATAVGMALAERLLAARFGRSLVDHRTWVIVVRRRSDGGHQPRGRRPRRPPLPLQAHRPLRRQPHLDRWRHLRLLLGRCAEAVLRLWLGGRDRSTATTRRRSTPRCPSRSVPRSRH